MLGSKQAKIIGILRVEFEKDPKKFLTIREVLDLLDQSNSNKPTIAYNTVATILKRLADQQKINSYEQNNRYFFQYKDISNQTSDKILSIFLRAFGSSGLNLLIEKSKNLSEDDIQELMDLVDTNEEQ